MIGRLLPLIVFLGLGGLLFAGIQLNRVRDSSVVQSPLIGKPAPDFRLPELLDPAREVARADLLGQVYLLNVWASWCVSCRLEHPVLEAFSASGEVPLIGLNWKDEKPDALRWLRQFGNPYAAIAHDPDNRVGLHFGVYGTPETFLIDAEGTIRYKHIGPLTFDIIDQQVRPLLRELRGEG